jgi:hypothetical protein
MLSDAVEQRIRLDIHSANENRKHVVQIRIWRKSGKFSQGGEMTLSSTDRTAFREMVKAPA